MLTVKSGLAVIGGAIAGNVVAWSQAALGGQHAPFTFATIVGNAIVPIVLALLTLHTQAPPTPATVSTIISLITGSSKSSS